MLPRFTTLNRVVVTHIYLLNVKHIQYAYFCTQHSNEHWLHSAHNTYKKYKSANEKKTWEKKRNEEEKAIRVNQFINWNDERIFFSLSLRSLVYDGILSNNKLLNSLQTLMLQRLSKCYEKNLNDIANNIFTLKIEQITSMSLCNLQIISTTRELYVTNIKYCVCDQSFVKWSD